MRVPQLEAHRQSWPAQASVATHRLVYKDMRLSSELPPPAIFQPPSSLPDEPPRQRSRVEPSSFPNNGPSQQYSWCFVPLIGTACALAGIREANSASLVAWSPVRAAVGAELFDAVAELLAADVARLRGLCWLGDCLPKHEQQRILNAVEQLPLVQRFLHRVRETLPFYPHTWVERAFADRQSRQPAIDAWLSAWNRRHADLSTRPITQSRLLMAGSRTLSSLGSRLPPRLQTPRRRGWLVSESSRICFLQS